MIVIFTGVESIDHRTTLLSITDLFEPESSPWIVGGVSYRGLRRRRLGGSYIKETCQRIPIFLDHGAYKATWTREEALKHQDDYYSFLDSVPEVLSAVQFDHPSLSDDDLVLPEDVRVVPVLRDGSDMKRLSLLLDQYRSVALEYTGDKRLPAILRSKSKDDPLILALNQSNLDVASKAGFTAVSTGAWTVPAQYGDPIVWDGKKAVRISGVNKSSILNERGPWLESAGFSLDQLRHSDPREWNRVAIYSYLLWAASLRPDVSDTSAPSVMEKSSSQQSVSQVRPSEPASGRMVLPVFSTSVTSSLEADETGSVGLRNRSITHSSNQTLRKCDTCFLSSTCPAFEAGSECKFDLPVEVRTDAQAKALMYTMVEIQAARVAFARFAEEVNGGYPDPVVGQEMDRLMRLTTQVTKPTERRERLTVSVESESSGAPGAGVLSRLFGGGSQNSPSEPTVIEAVDISEVPAIPPRNE